MWLKYNKNSYKDSHPGLPLDPDVVQPGAFKWPPHLTPSLQLTVFVGGCLGALAHYGVTIIIPDETNGWPYATLIVNLFGAFALGFLLQTLFHQGSDDGRRKLLRLGIGTGFVGAFTTYSSLAVETDLLIGGNHVATAVTYALVTVIAGIVLSAFGIYVASKRHKVSAGIQL